MPDADDTLINLRFDLLGASAPEDHHYLLYAAIKSTLDLGDITERGWQLRKIQGGRVQENETIHFDRRDADPYFCIRLPMEDIGRARALEGETIRLSHHLLQVGAPVASEIKHADNLESDLVIIKNGDRAPRGHSEGDLGASVGKRLGAWLGRSDFGIEVGERRWVHVAGARYFGSPVKISALREGESELIQRRGIGGRQSMGCGTFWAEG